MRLNWRNVNAGLWVNGGREEMPENTLRISNGLSPIKTVSARSRWGSNQVYPSIDAVSLYRFAGNNVAVDSSGRLYFNGSIKAVGFSGDRVTFVKMPPNIGTQDYLFVADSQKMVKMDETGHVTNWGIVPPTRGLNPTSNFFKLYSGILLLSFDGDSGNWTVVNATKADDNTFKVQGTGSLRLTVPKNRVATATRALSYDLTNLASNGTWMAGTAYTVGQSIYDSNGNYQVVLVGGTSGGSAPAWSTIFTPDGNSTNDNGIIWLMYEQGHSQPQDIITMWIGVDVPVNIQSAQLDFDLGSNFTTDYYSFSDITVDSTELQSASPSSFTGGVGQAVVGNQNTDNEQKFVRYANVPGTGSIVSGDQVRKAMLNTIHRKNQKVPPHANNWYQLTIAKEEFTRIGTNQSLTWANVSKVRITVTTTGSGTANLWFDALELMGGAGMEGAYNYAFTWGSSATGIFSNPNPQDPDGTFPDKVSYVGRTPLYLVGIPQSSDPQVDRIQVWRTLGNGANLFLAFQIFNSSPSATDFVSDFPGFNGRYPVWQPSLTVTVGYSILDNNNFVQTVTTAGTTGTSYPAFSTNPTSSTSEGTVTWINGGANGQLTLGDTAIALTNINPGNFNRIAGPFQGSMFWCGDSANPGRLYYSTPGLPCGYNTFIDITNMDDPLQMPVIYNGGLYVVSEKTIYQVQLVNGITNSVFTAVPMQACVGTIYPFTIVDAGTYMFFWNTDGIQMFDGNQTQLLQDGMTTIFRGEASEIYPAFNSAPSAHYVALHGSMGTTAAFAFYARNEYIISDNVNAYALNITTMTWRNLSAALTAGTYGLDNGEILATLAGAVVLYEHVGALTDNGAAINWKMQTLSQEPDPSRQWVFQRLYIDVNTNGQVVTPSLILDNQTIPLPPFVSTSRQRIEYTTGLPGQLIAVLLTASLTAQLEMFGLSADVV